MADAEVVGLDGTAYQGRARCRTCSMPQMKGVPTFAFDGDSLGPYRGEQGERFACVGCFNVKKAAFPDTEWSWMPRDDDPVWGRRRAYVASMVTLANAARSFSPYGYVRKVLAAASRWSSDAELDAKSARNVHLARECLRLGNRCAYCRDVLLRRTATVDHKVPLIRLGGDAPSNLTWACEDCNTTKTFLTDSEFMDLLRDDTSVAVPSILGCQERYRRNLGLPTDAIAAMRATINVEDGTTYWTPRSRSVRKTERWEVGMRVTVYDWTPDGGPVAGVKGVVTWTSLDAREARVDLGTRIARVSTTTFREVRLPFERTFEERRWLLDVSVANMTPERLDGIFRYQRKLRYIRSFLRMGEPGPVLSAIDASDELAVA